MNKIIFDQAWDKILNYISSGDKTQSEIKKKINIYPKEIQEKILEMLNEYNLISDKNFAERFVLESLEVKFYGKLKIKSDLKSKNISSEIICDVLENISDEQELESACRFIKKLRGEIKLDKIKAKLYRRGFSGDIISRVIKKFLDENK